MAVDGTYKVEVDTPIGKQEATLTLTTDGTALSGSTESVMGSQEFSGGTVNGDQVSWNMEINSPIGKMELIYNATVSDDTISGEVKTGNFGTSLFKGVRI